MNAGYLGEYLVDRDTAMARVEKDIEHAMEMVLHDWAVSESAGAAPDQQRQRSLNLLDERVQINLKI